MLMLTMLWCLSGPMRERPSAVIVRPSVEPVDAGKSPGILRDFFCLCFSYIDKNGTACLGMWQTYTVSKACRLRMPSDNDFGGAEESSMQCQAVA